MRSEETENEGKKKRTSKKKREQKLVKGKRGSIINSDATQVWNEAFRFNIRLLKTE